MSVLRTPQLIVASLMVLATSVCARAASLSAPYNLTATAASSSTINLAWSDSNTSETGFQVWQSLDGVNWGSGPIATTTTNWTTYTAAGLKAATRYYYHVRAINSNSQSAYSNIASATTFAATTTTTSSTTTTTLASALPTVPTGITASAVSCSQINIRWNASTGGTGGIRAYNLYGWRNSTRTFLKQV